MEDTRVAPSAASRQADRPLDGTGCLLLDGGLASELERAGHDLNDPLWSARVLLEDPGAIEAVHHAFLEAGADCITTATYQATFQGLAAHGLSATEAGRVLVGAVELAVRVRDRFCARGDPSRAERDPRAANDRLAAGHDPARAPRPHPLVAASIGPYGAFLADGSEYRGDYGIGRAALADFHRRRWEVLAHSGADVLLCETLPTLVEARALADLARESAGVAREGGAAAREGGTAAREGGTAAREGAVPVREGGTPAREGAAPAHEGAAPGRADAAPATAAATPPAWFSFSCRDEGHLSDGTPIAEVAAWAEACEVVGAVGVNCTAPRFLPGLVAALAAGTAKPILAYPNAGGEWDAARKRWGRAEGEAEWAETCRAWIAAGAAGVGGCCRVGPEDIREMRAAIPAGQPAGPPPSRLPLEPTKP